MNRCPNCNRPLSDKAVMCPECGHIVKKSSSRGDFTGCIMIVIMIIVFVVGISWLLFLPFKNKKPSTKQFAILAILIMWVSIFLYFGYGMGTYDYHEAYVNVELANLRENPYGRIIDKLSKGTSVSAMKKESSNESWWGVKLSDGKKGVMHKSVLKVTDNVIEPEWYKCTSAHLLLLIIAACLYVIALLDTFVIKKS